ncbi:hypothetical protein D3C75_1080230 [compost metagenome]
MIDLFIVVAKAHIVAHESVDMGRQVQAICHAPNDNVAVGYDAAHSIVVINHQSTNICLPHDFGGLTQGGRKRYSAYFAAHDFADFHDVLHWRILDGYPF